MLLSDPVWMLLPVPLWRKAVRCWWCITGQRWGSFPFSCDILDGGRAPVRGGWTLFLFPYCLCPASSDVQMISFLVGIVRKRIVWRTRFPSTSVYSERCPDYRIVHRWVRNTMTHAISITINHISFIFIVCLYWKLDEFQKSHCQVQLLFIR